MILMNRYDDRLPLDIEILQEKAQALGRTGRALSRAVAALREFDDTPQRDGRDMLVDGAAEQLWHLIIQREACGITAHEEVLAQYDIPAEVFQRMGARRRPQRPPRGSSITRDS